HISLSSPTSEDSCSLGNAPGRPWEVVAGRILGPALSFVIPGDTDYGSFATPCVVDSLTATESLGIYGTVSGTATGSQIQGSLDGNLDYYRLAEPRGALRCSAKDHVMVFRRR